MQIIINYNRDQLIMLSEQIELKEIRLDVTPTLEDVPVALLPNILELLGEKARPKMELQKRSSFSWFAINPFTKRSFLFSLIYLNIFYLIQLQISLEIAFGPTFISRELLAGTTSKIIYICFLTFLLFDILLSFQKGYYAYGQGRVILELKEIRKHYLKKQFLFDITAVVIYCIPLFAEQYALNFAQLIPSALLWTKKAQHQKEMNAFLQGNWRSILAIAILCIDVLMLGNYGACIFVGMDLLLLRVQFFGSNITYYWLSNNSSYPYNLVGGLWYVQYVYAQSFSTGTLSTLAPGPFAKNPFEILYAIIVMIFFMLLASYVGQVIVTILYSESRLRIFHQQNIQSFDVFMQLKCVAHHIRTKVYNFFELIWEAQVKLQSDQQQQLIEILPTSLKQQLLVQIGFAKNLPFLNHLPQTTQLIRMTSLALTRTTLDNDSLLYDQNDPTIYYLKEGMAKYYISQSVSRARTHICRSNTPRQSQSREMDLLNDSPNSVNKPIRSSSIIAQRDVEFQIQDSVDYHEETFTVEKIINMSNVQRYIGVYEFVCGIKPIYQCRTVDLCSVQALSLSAFSDIVDKLSLKEQFHMLREQTMIYKDLDKIQKLCIICLKNHLEDQCYELFPNKMIEKKMKNIGQKEMGRRKTLRKNRKKMKKIINNNKPYRVKEISLFQAFQTLEVVRNIINLSRIIDFQAVTMYENYYPQYNLKEF